MANPQTENGYIQIATEVWEALSRVRVPGEAMQVLMVILRKTWGYKKKVDYISLSQFCLATGLNRNHVCAALKKLSEMNLVSPEKRTCPEKRTDEINTIPEFGTCNTTQYRFNKDFDTWKPLPKKGRPEKRTCPEKGKKSYPNSGHTKDNIKRKNTGGDSEKSEPPQKTSERKTDPRIAACFQWYSEEHKRTRGHSPLIDGGKDGGLVKKLLAVLDKDGTPEAAEEELKRIVTAMFESRDEFIRRSGYTIGVLYSCFQKIRSALKPARPVNKWPQLTRAEEEAAIARLI